MMIATKKIGTILMTSMLLWGFQFAAPGEAQAKKYKKHPHQYKYMYYPASQVYYSPVKRVYYYPYSGGWRTSTAVPVGINLGNGVSINLGGTTPYVYHPTVIQQYPVVVVP